MFEARFKQAIVLKKLVDAIKDLVTQANWECTSEGISMQAMDSSHVSLVSMTLKPDGFDSYRCDRNLSMGINMASLAKILKCAGNEDAVTMSTEDDGDVVNFVFESDKGTSSFELKMLDIDSEHLGIPETEYKCTVQMPGGEFQKIVRDLAQFGDACTIGVAKSGVEFTVKGDMGTAKVTRKANKDAEKEAEQTIITMEEPTELSFALRYLTNITKATPLADSCTLHMSKGVPLMAEYRVETMGAVQYFLAPKIEDEEGGN